MFKRLYCTLVKRLSVIYPNGAESNKLLVILFRTRLGNLESQPYRGQSLWSVVLILVLVVLVRIRKQIELKYYENTDYVRKVMRTLNNNYKLSVGGIYGTSSLLDLVLKRKGRILFSSSLNSNSSIDLYYRPYKLSMTIYKFNNKIFNPIIAPN